MDNLIGIPDSGKVLDGFFDAVSRAEKRALMLDYDGTLAPFVVERDRAFPYPGVREAVDSIMEQGRSRVVVVSGRAVRDILPLMGFRVTPEVWGSHGWERLGPDGVVTVPETGALERSGIEAAVEWAVKSGHAGRAEVKPSGVAFHTRGLEEAQASRLRDEAKSVFDGIASRGGFDVRGFDGGVELRLSGMDKGDTVRELLAELGPDAAAAYLGDDDTDEDAFRALKGKGLGVLVRVEPRESAASLWIRPPEGLLVFLDRWRAACGR